MKRSNDGIGALSGSEGNALNLPPRLPKGVLSGCGHFDTLRTIVDFSFKQGFHELGYDIVGEIAAELDNANERLIKLNHAPTWATSWCCAECETAARSAPEEGKP